MRKEDNEEIIEELAMVLCHIDGMYWNDLTLTEASDYKKKTELVCLRVDRELPELYPWDIDTPMEQSAHEAQQDMLKAGFGAFDPLIEEKESE